MADAPSTAARPGNSQRLTGDLGASSLPGDVPRFGAWLIRTVSRRRFVGEVLFGIAAVAAVIMLTACGGSDDSTTNPQSKNYDPATTALANAGLQVCSEEQESIGAQLSSLPGLQLTRKFDVAKDCQGATVTLNKVTLFQFSNKPDFQPGVPGDQVRAAAGGCLRHLSPGDRRDGARSPGESRSREEQPPARARPGDHDYDQFLAVRGPFLRDDAGARCFERGVCDLPRAEPEPFE